MLTPSPTSQDIQILEDRLTPERLQRIRDVLQQRTRYLTLVLEDIYQPHNAAAIMRSCEAFGVQDLHLIENHYRFQPSRGVSTGAEKWLTLHRYRSPLLAEIDRRAKLGKVTRRNPNHKLAVTNTQEALQELKAAGYRLAATVPDDGAIPIDEAPLDRPLALLLGTEKLGLSPEAIEMADCRLFLPMQGFTRSFNVSVCAALCLQSLTHRIRRQRDDWELTAEEQARLYFHWLCQTVRGAEQILGHT